MFELNNFHAIRIGIASPEKIREWSHGEVTKAETINYRTQKPEKDGLFCERIFGPTKDYECHCGRYKRIRYKGFICDKCGVEITKKTVRRERMGHIELACPVSHIWFFKGIPSRIGACLDITAKALEQVLYYVSYIVLDKGTTDFEEKQVISDREYREAQEKFGYGSFRAGMGAEAIKELLQRIDVEKKCKELRELSNTSKGAKKLKIDKRLEIMESFLKSGNKPSWMILDCIPVIPPELRPMVQLDGGRYATSDLNDLYRRLINRNNRLKKLIELRSPEVIIRNEKRMVQEAVDSLIENGKRGKAVLGPRNRELKSLTTMLKGKQGRFRQNLLGKRVDYSGRSVIVVGPELKIYQCGLPKEMAKELFKPFIVKRLVEMNYSHNPKSAKRLIEREKPIIWDILAEVIKDHPVLLNRQPTLHKLGIQAFEPVLIEGRAIKLHPLVCPGFGADFDGDQMAVHVPLSLEARAEARFLMLASNNIIKPSDGKPIVTPAQDIVMGSYYLTMIKPDAKGTGMIFASEDEALLALANGDIHIEAEITVRRSVEIDGKTYTGRVKTTAGRIIYNQVVPQNIGLVDRTNPENYLKYEIDVPVDKKLMSKIVINAFNILGPTKTAVMLDEIKALGFKYSTLSGITVSVFDMKMPDTKYNIVEEAEKRVLETEKMYRRGFITKTEKVRKNCSIWNETTEILKKEVIDNLDPYCGVSLIAKSGARGNMDQVKQLSGMIGIIANASGVEIDIPVKTSYSEGLSSIEYFLSSRGGRKGLTDKALKTADAGYLTRRLVDVCQDIMITTHDCFADLNEKPKGTVVSEIVKDGTVIESLENRIYGRVAVEDVIHPKTKQVIVKADELIDLNATKEIVNAGIKSVNIRTVLTCKAHGGICAKCYGKDMSRNRLVDVGEPVGVISAQAIGEPGTQLTMKTFQTGGVATAVDITQGLPRVEELFEARRPKGVATISEVSGKCEVRELDKRIEVIIKTSDDEVSYLLPYGTRCIVKNGETVRAGTPLTAGALDPKDILSTLGIKAVQDYLLAEVLNTYRSQDVDINAKHIEVVVKQMLRKVIVADAGDTSLVAGAMTDLTTVDKANEETLAKGGKPALSRRVILGITKASLATESFLSAASFQETSSVLTEAALKGKVDLLKGLKENVIIGKRIPAGTGIKKYRKLEPEINKVTATTTEVADAE